jgi:hypothetical protein
MTADLIPWAPVDNWATLEGKRVEIYEGGRIIDQGKVDVTTYDGSVLWLSPGWSKKPPHC